MAYARAGLARAALAQGDTDATRGHLEAAGRLNRNNDMALLLLGVWAELAAFEGRWERAVELAARVVSHSGAWHSVRRRADRLLERAAACLDPAAHEAAAARGRALDLRQAAEGD
jgi:hypothetical protein